MTDLKEKQNVILDFSHVYPSDIEEQVKNIKRIDLSELCGTNMYCTEEAENQLRERLEPYGPQEIHFLDNGNYHYITKLFSEKIDVPFCLYLFDHHSDMQQPLIHELTSCGSWAGEILRENPLLEQLVLIGPEQKSIKAIPGGLKKKMVCISMQEIEKKSAREEVKKIKMELPAYISIDKDVLDRYGARTNWNQGNMSIETLENILQGVFMHQEVIGVDICGECSLTEPVQQLMEDEKINRRTNALLYQFLSNYIENRFEK